MAPNNSKEFLLTGCAMLVADARHPGRPVEHRAIDSVAVIHRTRVAGRLSINMKIYRKFVRGPEKSALKKSGDKRIVRVARKRIHNNCEQN